MSQTDILLEALRRGPVTKLDLFKLGGGLSANSRVADLRRQGYVIDCAVAMRNGRRVWVYTLVGPRQGELALALPVVRA